MKAELSPELQQLLGGEDGAGPASPDLAELFRPADELLREVPPEPEWQWEGMTVPGEITLFAARAKLGKSEFLRALVEATVNDAPDFLGRDLRGGPVLYASEEGLGTLAANFPRHPDAHLLHRGAAWPKPAWQDLVAATAAKAREVEAVLAVIDTFSFWNGLERDAEQNAGAVQPLLDALVEVANTGAAVLLVHHVRKSGGEDGDAIRGTGAITAAVDAFVEYERVPDAPANHRQLVVTPRWTAPPVLIVEWQDVFGFRVVGQAADREGAGTVGWDERIIACLPSDGEGATMGEIEELLGGDKRKWHKALAKLLEEGRVERTGKGSRGSPYRHRRPPTDSVPRNRPDHEDGKDGNTLSSIPSFRPTGTERNRSVAEIPSPSSVDGKSVGCASHAEPAAGCRYCRGGE